MFTKIIKWLVALIVIGAVGFLSYRWWLSKQSVLPAGIVCGNGRIEAKQVDIATKEALRIKDLFADEGDLVERGQVLVQMDTVTLESELATAKADVIAAQERESICKAAIIRCKSQLNLANIELDRAARLLKDNAASQREYDARKAQSETAAASLEEEQARLRTAAYEVDVARARVLTIQTRITDATLRSPVRGRVLYRLAEVGEVLGPGGKALTLVNLQDVYMEIFLPAEQAGRLKIGDDARIAFDFAPGRAVRGYVSFVSPEAQFTPKQVETQSEREKLMFRVKIQVPADRIAQYIQNVKTGVRGLGYVRFEPSAVWPEWLQRPLMPATQPHNPPGAAAVPASATSAPTTTPER